MFLALALAYIGFADHEAKFEIQAYILNTQDGRNIKLNLKVARNYLQKNRGLMFVKEMGEDQGMIFINDAPSISKFWMKNTYIPLDFLFIDETGRILQIYQNAKPLDEHTHISSFFPVLYTIELNAGFVKNRNIKVGDKIKIASAIDFK